jgi:hypothetical protein
MGSDGGAGSSCGGLGGISQGVGCELPELMLVLRLLDTEATSAVAAPKMAAQGSQPCAHRARTISALPVRTD